MRIPSSKEEILRMFRVVNEQELHCFLSEMLFISDKNLNHQNKLFFPKLKSTRDQGKFFPSLSDD
jgi:hypothetical protein